jgi:hypothetical protein
MEMNVASKLKRTGKWTYLSAAMILSVLVILSTAAFTAPKAPVTGGPHGSRAPQVVTNLNCSGSACDGWDAFSSGCAAANDQLLQTVTYPNGGKIEIHWSATCSTNWAICYNGTGNGNTNMLCYTHDRNNLRRTSQGGGFNTTGTISSPMEYAPNVAVQGCMVANSGPTTCTSFF